MYNRIYMGVCTKNNFYEPDYKEALRFAFDMNPAFVELNKNKSLFVATLFQPNSGNAGALIFPFNKPHMRSQDLPFNRNAYKVYYPILE